MSTPWRAGRLLPGRGRRLLFGRGYEDPEIELAAFGPPSGHVLAIAAAGEVPAALARAGFTVTAVDVNPVQLDHCRARLAGAPATDGSAEHLLRAGRAVLRGVSPPWRDLAGFLAMTDVHQQVAHWDHVLRTATLDALLASSLRPLGAVLRRGFRDAVPPRLDTLLLARVRRGLARHPNADNPWAHRLLAGTERPGPDPLHGVPDGAVELVRADLMDHLTDLAGRSAQGRRYDAVTLSNVLDGPDAAWGARLRRLALDAVRPGGVVVTRSFAEPPTGQDDGLAAHDRAFLWGTVEVVRR